MEQIAYDVYVYPDDEDNKYDEDKGEDEESGGHYDGDDNRERYEI